MKIPSRELRLARILAVPSLVTLVMIVGCGTRLMPPEHRPTSVQVETVKIASVPVTKSLIGEFQARVESDMSFRIGGRIDERTAEVGQRVSVGDVLARLDSLQQVADVDAATAAVRSAKAQYEERSANFGRIEQLLERNAASEEEFDAARAESLAAKSNLLIAQGNLELAELQLSYTDLKATVEGIIIARQAETGQVVTPGVPVFTIAVDGERDVVFDTFSTDATDMPDRDNIELSLQTDPTVKTVGFIREISPKIDKINGTVRVRVGVPDPPAKMTLGAVIVGVAHFEPAELIRLPWSSLSRKGDLPAVWVVDSTTNTVSEKAIGISSYAAGEILVSSGLEDGDLVVTNGAQLIRPGQKVTLVMQDSQP